MNFGTNEHVSIGIVESLIFHGCIGSIDVNCASSLGGDVSSTTDCNESLGEVDFLVCRDFKRRPTNLSGSGGAFRKVANQVASIELLERLMAYGRTDTVEPTIIKLIKSIGSSIKFSSMDQKTYLLWLFTLGTVKAVPLSCSAYNP